MNPFVSSRSSAQPQVGKLVSGVRAENCNSRAQSEDFASTIRHQNVQEHSQTVMLERWLGTATSRRVLGPSRNKQRNHKMRLRIKSATPIHRRMRL